MTAKTDLPTFCCFDWNGTLLADLKRDEETFSVKIVQQDEEVMGCYQFTIEGAPEDVQRFLDHYDFELDEVV